AGGRADREPRQEGCRCGPGARARRQRDARADRDPRDPRCARRGPRAAGRRARGWADHSRRGDVTAALPIDAVLPEIVSALRARGQLVLSAAPGAGKTTRVPAALLDAGLADGRSVVVLEPRRIAARAAAEFVAGARGEAVGRSIGYRVRFEQRGSAQTQLWFITEGVFGRWLTANPLLDDVGIVVLDEFHERHLQGDVALAVVRTLITTVRTDLRLVVMSATLETMRLAEHLDGAPVVTCPGRAHPVTIEHEDRPADPR